MHNRQLTAHKKRASESAQLVLLQGEDKTPAATSAELRGEILSYSFYAFLRFVKQKNQGLTPGFISNEDKYQLAVSSD